jgi:hypothetical protein
MKKKIWIIDLIAFIGFLLAFKPQITGYTFHEWLGLAVGFTLILHLLQHWRWVKSICRTLNCAKTKLRIRFFLDGFMGLGLITIILTGLVMSSILNLELRNYETWRIVHFSASYITLVLLVAKIALHWRLINNMIAKAFSRPDNQMIMTPEQVSRRKFLKDAGFASMGLLGLVVAGSGVNALLKNVRGASANVENQAVTQVDQVATAQPTATSTSTLASTSNATPNAVATNQPTPTYTLEPTATPTTVVQTGRALCNKHCAYPGRCRLYVDNNQNGLCDRGEYIW